MCVRVGVYEHKGVCKWACGRGRGCVHACVGVADGWVHREFSIQGFNSCDSFPELQLPKFFICLTTKPKDVAHRGQSQAEAPGPGPA